MKTFYINRIYSGLFYHLIITLEINTSVDLKKYCLKFSVFPSCNIFQIYLKVP